MKNTLFVALFAVTSATSVLMSGDPMKLVNTQTGYTVVEFLDDGNIRFNDRFLEAEMKESGILIPPSLLDSFEGKEFVYFGDPLFERAFKEVYYPYSVSTSIYKWQPLSDS